MQRSLECGGVRCGPGAGTWGREKPRPGRGGAAGPVLWLPVRVLVFISPFPHSPALVGL